MDATAGSNDTGTGIIALGRVEEEAEESTFAHSYTALSNKRGKCCWEGCPGLITSAGAKRRHGYNLYIHCKQRSGEQNKVRPSIYATASMEKGWIATGHTMRIIA